MTFPWTNFVPTRTDPMTEYRAASEEFDARRYTAAAERLEWILAQPTDHRHSLTHVRELLARSYYHSAQLHKAEEAIRALLADRPDHAWGLMLLARTLQRQGKEEEAQRTRAVAEAMGQAS